MQNTWRPLLPLLLTLVISCSARPDSVQIEDENPSDETDSKDTNDPDTADSDADTDSDSDSDGDGDGDNDSDSESMEDADTHSDGSDSPDTNGDTADTEPAPFWVPKGPKQLKPGHVELNCSLDVLITENGLRENCNTAPVPCIPDEPKVTCEMRILGEEDNVEYDGLVGIERRGRSSIQYNKPSYAFEFRFEDGSDNPVPCMGMGKESDWILDGSWVDRSFLRNNIVLDIFSELGPKTHYGPDSRFVELTFNGEAQGIYRLVEKIKRDDDRVDIPKDDGTGETFIIKHDDDGTLSMPLGLIQNRWGLVYPNDSNVTDTQLNAIEGWMTDFAEALNAGDAFTMLNMDNVVDFVLLQELAKNIDGFQFSLYLFKEKGELANMVPWDFDLAFGQPRIDEDLSWPNESPEGWVAHHSNLIARFLDDEEFTARLETRFAQLRTGPLSLDAIDTRIDEYLMVLSDDVIENNFNIWPMENVAFEYIYSPYHLYDIESHSAEISKLRQWIHDRLAWMDDHLSEYAAYSDSIEK
ncbi:MAG: CotH kinase family protein [Deltaproteobacteria bacterium]|nr:CotH kinase family protein [Deltaproteobacteria bacterium]